jgi:hypothetical protein
VLNTYTPPSGTPRDNCNLCHGTDSDFSVSTVHNITTLDPIHLAYPREPE